MNYKEILMSFYKFGQCNRYTFKKGLLVLTALVKIMKFLDWH